jgi:hypothetical protein
MLRFYLGHQPCDSGAFCNNRRAVSNWYEPFSRIVLQVPC